jgi:hypothetical protein
MWQSPWRDDAPLRFSNERKLRRQMQKRGWTESTIRQALEASALPAQGKHGRAFRYVHAVTGNSVVVDAASGDIFHHGRERYGYG